LLERPARIRLLTCAAWLAAALSAACHIRYEAVEAQAEALERPYQALATLLNCERDEIALLQSATAAWTQARPGPPRAAPPLGLCALRGGGRAWAVCAQRRSLRSRRAPGLCMLVPGLCMRAFTMGFCSSAAGGPRPCSCCAFRGSLHGACARSAAAAA
jgi:hypothetical protein